jgi:N-acetylmuramoyl-L-alanine amidase
MHGLVKKVVLGFVLCCLVVFGGLTQTFAENALISITDIDINKDGEITLKANDSLDPYQQFSSLKLMNPHRLVVDLPNVKLTGDAAKLMKNAKNGRLPIPQVDELVELSVQQSESLFYQSVRLTVVAKDYPALNRLAFTVSGKTATIELLPPQANVLNSTTSVVKPTSLELPGSNPPNILEKPGLPESTAIVTAARYVDGDYHLVTDKNHAPLKLTKRFNLSSPSRLVMDFSPAVLAHRGLSASTTIGDDAATDLIRVGQFDESTVRVVVETTTPDRYKAYFSDNQATGIQQAIISRSTKVNPADAPEMEKVTTIKQIGLDPSPNGGAVIRVATQGPLAHRWFKDDGHLVIQLLNVSAEPGQVSFDNKRFPMLKQMAVTAPFLGPQLGAAAPSQESSQLVVALTNSIGWNVTTDMADDGKTLVMTIDPDIVVMAPGAKIPFKATVVVDAGHGGKDQGASRAGVREKDLTLSIAHQLRAALQARGVTVHMTRSQDTFLPLSTITSISNGHRPDAFVSVHINASTNPAINGIETYYYHGRSIPLAKSVHRQLVATQGRADRGTRRARFYVINHTPHPAILCEVGYISNTNERQQLLPQANHARMANAIADGVVRYLIEQRQR